MPRVTDRTASMEPLSSTPWPVACSAATKMPESAVRISPVASLVCLASSFTELATTLKPRPASPARAASSVALSDSTRVCIAMCSMSWSTPSTFRARATRLPISEPRVFEEWCTFSMARSKPVSSPTTCPSESETPVIMPETMRTESPTSSAFCRSNSMGLCDSSSTSRVSLLPNG